MSRLLQYCQKSKEGFVLSYCLFVLIIIFSMTTFVALQVVQKKNIEENILMIEEQKNVELLIYSYFLDNLTEEDFTINIDDFTLEYSTTKEDNTLTMCAGIENGYTYKFYLIYDLEEEKVTEVNYEN